MKAPKRRQTGPKLRAITVGGLDRSLVLQLRADAKANHRSLAGHIRALLENAMSKEAA